MRISVPDSAAAELTGHQAKLIIENAVDYAIVGLDPSGKIISWNVGATRMMAWTASEAIGCSIDLFFAPEDVGSGIPARQLSAAVRHGRSVDERWHLKRDGSRFWASGETMPLRGTDGAPEGYVTILRDRTEQRTAAQAQSATDDGHRALYDSIDEGFCLIEVRCDDSAQPIDYRFLNVNPAFERQTGLIDAPGKWMRELAPDHEQHWFDTYAQIARTGEPKRFTLPAQALDARWYEVFAYRVGGASERLVAILFSDVTERRVSEARLKASQEHQRSLNLSLRSSEANLRLLLDAISEGFYAVDRDGLTTTCNAAFLRMMGFASAEDVIGRRLHDVIHHSHPDGSHYDEGECPIYVAARDGVAAHVLEELFFPIDREPLWVEYRATPIVRDGRLEGAICTFLDISERRARKAALASSEARQRAIFESAFDFAMVVTNPTGIVTDWNPGAEHVMGWTAAEIRGDDAARFFTPEDRASGRVQFEMQLALQNGRATDERWHQRKDGQRFWASGEMVPLFDGVGAHLGFVKILRDRTTEHLAGAALEEAQQRFQTILNTISAAFAIVEVKFDADDRAIDYRFIEANPAFERQAGVNLRGKWVTEFAPDLERFWFDTYGHVAKTGEPANIENYAEAFKRWFDVRAVRIGDPADHQIAILFSDVTARRQADERLRASEALALENVERVQLALAAGAIIGTWHWDLSRDQFTVDEAFAAAFGLDPALGRDGIPFAQIVATVHPDDQVALAAAMNEAIAHGGAYAHQYRVRRADGKYYWIEANGRVDHGSDGTPLRFPGVLIDVEGRRAIEAERDRAIAALRALNETLEQRVAQRGAELMQAEEKLRQSQKMEAVGQLTGGLAHDFNNLLAGVAGALELMGRRIGQGRLTEIDKYMAAAQGSVRRAAALTHRLLAFSRRQTLDPRPTNVDALVEGMTELIQRTVGPSIAIETVFTPEMWPALVDASQLENALLNLCINARDAMPEGGHITIETANLRLDRVAARAYDLPDGQYLSLAVSDTGTGMSPEVIARVFEPFYTTKPIGQGTGLGLSMIYGFAQQSGGQVRIHSHVGRGTTVRIYLPRFEGHVPTDDNGEIAAPTPFAEAGETVLVVDDEATVRMLVADVLGDLGYTVIEAADGSAGLKLLRSDAKVDLLITDVGLPGGMNGRQMADAGRVIRPTLKTLFITGYAAETVIGKASLEPGMRVLTKPFTVDALAASIRQLMKD